MAVPNKSFQPKPGGFKKPNAGGGFNKGGFNRGRFAPRKEAEHRINHFIRVPQVRLVGDNVEAGIYVTRRLSKRRRSRDLISLKFLRTLIPRFVRSLIIINSSTIKRRKKKR